MDRFTCDFSQQYEFTVKWTLRLKTIAGANVEIKDTRAATEYSGEIGTGAELEVPLIQYLCRRSGNVFDTPHFLSIAKGNQLFTRTAIMDQPRVIEIYDQKKSRRK